MQGCHRVRGDGRAEWLGLGSINRSGANLPGSAGHPLSYLKSLNILVCTDYGVQGHVAWVLFIDCGVHVACETIFAFK